MVCALSKGNNKMSMVDGMDNLENLGDETAKMIRLRIQHTLSIFPKLSHSMIQLGVGTGFPPKIWAPVLDAMVDEGVVSKTSVTATHPATGRDQTYTIFELVTKLD